jgi:2-(1,2-epoxy-1,2-dihydrophenyl)acetyl-CoA isomerase
VTATVLSSTTDGVLQIRLNRPAAGNAVTPDVIAALDLAINEARTSGVRAVLLAGTGANFCVGADLRHFQSKPDDLAGELNRMADSFHAMIVRLASLPVPVVAAVQGNVVGAGVGLMLAADMIIAASDLRIITGYTKIGLSSDAGVSYFLTKNLGPRLARSVMMTNRPLDSDIALRMGLVDETCRPDCLADTATAAARRLAGGATPAFATIKRLVGNAADGATFEQQLALEQAEIVRLAAGEPFQAAIRAFANR